MPNDWPEAGEAIEAETGLRGGVQNRQEPIPVAERLGNKVILSPLFKEKKP
jgi:hypothetical protein